MDEKDQKSITATIDAEEETFASATQMQNRYAFWYHRRGGKSQTQSINYEESMKQFSTFQSIEHFWNIYNHMIRPNDIKTTTDYHLFKDGIKPTWEDPQNKNGGKWMVRLKKGLASLLWEEIILSVIGEQFDVGHEICGAVISIRNGEDIISIWNKTADNLEATNKIRDHMRRVMQLPPYVQIEYKKHVDSLADKSSFRNPTLVWKPKENLHHNKDSNVHYNKDARDGHHYNREGRESHHYKEGREYHKEGRESGQHYNKDNHNAKADDEKVHPGQVSGGAPRGWSKPNRDGVQPVDSNKPGSHSSGWSSRDKSSTPNATTNAGEYGWSSRSGKKLTEDTHHSPNVATSDWKNAETREKKSESESVWSRRVSKD